MNNFRTRGLIFIALTLFSACTSGRKTLEVSTYLSGEEIIRLRLGQIKIEPNEAFNTVADILPDMIISAGSKHGITVLRNTADAEYMMNVSLYRNNFLSSFHSYESLVLLISIVHEEKEIASALLSRDSRIPVDSYPFLYRALDSSLLALVKKYKKITLSLEDQVL